MQRMKARFAASTLAASLDGNALVRRNCQPPAPPLSKDVRWGLPRGQKTSSAETTTSCPG